MQTVHRKMLTAALKCNSWYPHEAPRERDFSSMEGCIFGGTSANTITIRLGEKSLDRSGIDGTRLHPSLTSEQCFS